MVVNFKERVKRSHIKSLQERIDELTEEDEEEEDDDGDVVVRT